MNKIFIVSLIVMCCSLSLLAQNSVYITIGDRSETITLVNNDATRRLLEILANGPMSVSLNDYGGFEKVGSLPMSLPTSDSRITTEPGDVILYQGRNLVIFYGSNTWSYTDWVKSIHCQLMKSGHFLVMVQLRLHCHYPRCQGLRKLQRTIPILISYMT